LTDLVMNLTW